MQINGNCTEMRQRVHVISTQNNWDGPEGGISQHLWAVSCFHGYARLSARRRRLVYVCAVFIASPGNKEEICISQPQETWRKAQSTHGRYSSYVARLASS